MPYYSLPSHLSLALLKKRYPCWGALLEKADERMLTSEAVDRLLGLSYRQLTDWEHRGMLKPIFARPMGEKAEGWRKFSVVDLLCLSFLKEAKRHGISITRLQGLMGKIFSVTGLFYEAIPHLVYGFDVYVYTDQIDWISVASTDTEDKWFRIPVDDVRESDVVVIIPLNGIVDDLFQRLNLPDFQAIKRPEGGYSFVINGVPLALEQLPDQEKDREAK